MELKIIIFGSNYKTSGIGKRTVSKQDCELSLLKRHLHRLHLGAVDAVCDAHVVLEVVAVLEGAAADGAGLSLLLSISVDVLDVALKAAAV